LEIFEKLAA